MRTAFLSLFAILTATFAVAENIYIQVAGPNYSIKDNTTTFSPQRVTAKVGDIVFFNFTSGNHSATQSTFAAPCQPAHDTNITINGFDSGFRDTANGTAVTVLSVPILPSNVNTTMWFYDTAPGACGSGAVGVINSNESSLETLAGFVRNADRLNGSSSSSSATGKLGSTSTETSSSASNTDSSSDAESMLAISSMPLVLLGFVLALL
ncbi:uncharacterized protein FOMMEDRAFT_101414 [Fomitiporia mediterranea MF3/22]|uniref:uncharacterized protein n=1 Tax=Fomitiporia mediterranea (strain MF3/22) TaxID=694068 RepID=UPI0004409082|nr:uncharacterized protein FOMMEDRAFT_101414 [Fomitiporia mediterranea MF3/22]EJD07999.1 hypothetical protein FOMMEDRAFT_101414 [Fomitiporia mediterranea MF3/22]